MNGLLTPGIALMQRLSYPKKFWLLGVFYLSFVYWGYQLYHYHSEEKAFAESEQAGLRYYAPVLSLLQYTQQHRGMAAGLLNGNESFRPKIAILEKDIAATLAKIDELDREVGAMLRTSNGWQRLKSDWNAVQSSYVNLSPERSFTVHTDLIGQIVDFMERLGNDSKLILDATPDGYHLAAILTTKAPALTEQLGQARAIGTSAISKGKLGSDDQVRLLGLAGSAKATLHSLTNTLPVIFEANALARQRLESPVRELSDAVQSFSQQIEQLAKSESRLGADVQANGALASGYFDQTSATIGKAIALANTAIPLLNQILQQRIDNLEADIVGQIIANVAVLTFIFYLFISFYRVVSSSVTGMDRFARQLADGDLTARLIDPAQDELGHAATSFNRAVQSLNGLMKELVESSKQLAASAHGLASVTDQTRGNMLRQQGETDQVASAMEELSATAEHIAVSATEAALAANQANQEAADGKRVVEQTIGIIHALASDVESTAGVVQRVSADSANITLVLDVIKDIAEQTNLLALNAAIEAARAGEQGRGFAVVADEVRTLASRTQQSTQKIRESIDKLQAGTQSAVKAMTESRNQARSCVEQTESARRSLDAIASSVGRINDMNSQIGSATEEQSQTVASVTQNLTSVTQLGTETVHGAQEASALGNALADLAARLETQVSRFRT
jgi:methyl-accepting chemotaxis protein